MRRIGVAAILGFAALLWPGLQNEARAGGWTLARGDTWVRVGFMVQITDDRYFFDGRRIPYFFEGHNETVGSFFDVRYGITDRLEASVQLPYFSIAFNDLAADRVTRGIGDLRVGLRYNVLAEPLVATLGAKIKFPTGEFDNDAEIVPVGEGQYDYELTLELARSLWPRPGYVTGLIGYRFRAENVESRIDPGNELFWSIEAGYSVVPWALLKVVARGLAGEASSAFGLTLPSLRRNVVYVDPGVVFALGRGSLEVSVPISTSGRNWPAGPVLNVGYFRTF